MVPTRFGSIDNLSSTRTGSTDNLSRSGSMDVRWKRSSGPVTGIRIGENLNINQGNFFNKSDSQLYTPLSWVLNGFLLTFRKSSLLLLRLPWWVRHVCVFQVQTGKKTVRHNLEMVCKSCPPPPDFEWHEISGLHVQILKSELWCTRQTFRQIDGEHIKSRTVDWDMK